MTSVFLERIRAPTRKRRVERVEIMGAVKCKCTAYI